MVPAANVQAAAEEVVDEIIDVGTTAEEVVQNEVGEASEPNSELDCEICDKSFKNPRALRAHHGRAHKVTGSPLDQLDGQSHKVLEETEDSESSSDEEIRSSDIEEHSCDRCDFVSKTESDVQAHKKRSHFTLVKGKGRNSR